MRGLSGLHFQYNKICKLKLWLFHHRITAIAHKNAYFKSGVVNDIIKYDDSSDLICEKFGIDDIEILGESVIIKENKPSSKKMEAQKSQLFYYMVVLSERFSDKKIIGKIKYPKQKETEKFELNSDIYVRVKSEREEIFDIVKKDNPPNKEKIDVCENCSYKRYCWC